MSKHVITLSAIETAWNAFSTIHAPTDPSRTMRVFATTTQATATNTGTLTLVLKKKGVSTAIASFDANVTPTANRTGADGASGDYIASVVFNATGNDKVDLLGGTQRDLLDYQWAIAFTAGTIFGGASTVSLYLDFDSEI